MVRDLVRWVSAMREKKEINIQIGEQVKRAREQANLTQEQMAERIEVSPQYVSDLERGVVGISIATLKRLYVELNISSDQILFGKHPENEASTIAEKCKRLSKKECDILVDVIDKFLEAMRLDKELKS